MYIIVGLGNPGKEYENTKHNVGFLTVDILAEKLGIRVNKIKHKALVGETFVNGEKVMLVKPQTYMNLSGESLREIFSFYKPEVEKLVVIYDDIDLAMGSLRIRKKGSAGTHNGMRSIIYHLESQDFPRVRVGIGGERKGDLANYVISGFKGEDKKTMEEAIVKAADAVLCLMERGIDIAMGEYNTKTKKKEKAKEKEENAQDQAAEKKAETAAPQEEGAAAGQQPGQLSETEGAAASAADERQAGSEEQIQEQKTGTEEKE